MSSSDAQLWLPPGSHVEEGEHPRDTVVIELREELGFSTVHEIAAPLMVTSATTVGLSKPPSGTNSVSVGATRLQAWNTMSKGCGPAGNVGFASARTSRIDIRRFRPMPFSNST